MSLYALAPTLGVSVLRGITGHGQQGAAVQVKAVVWIRLPLAELSASSEISCLNLQRLGDFDRLAAWGGREFEIS